MDLVVQSPDELVAAVPHVLGFKPEESIVLVPFRPGLPITRVDLPRTAADREEVWDALSDPYGRHAWPGARLAIVCISEDRRGAELASQHLSNRLQDVGITTRIRLRSDGERWREFNTGQTGLQTLSTDERIAAATVLTGAAQPAASRESLAAAMVGDREPIAQLLPAARVAVAASTLLRSGSGPGPARAVPCRRQPAFRRRRRADVRGPGDDQHLGRALGRTLVGRTPPATWPSGPTSPAAVRTMFARRGPQCSALPAGCTAKATGPRPGALWTRCPSTGPTPWPPLSPRPCRTGSTPRVGAISDPDARHRRRAGRVVRSQATRPAARHPGHAARDRPPGAGPLRRTAMNHNDDPRCSTAHRAKAATPDRARARGLRRRQAPGRHPRTRPGPAVGRPGLSTPHADVHDDNRLAHVKLSSAIEPGDLRVTELVSELGAVKVLDYLEAARELENHWGFTIGHELAHGRSRQGP